MTRLRFAVALLAIGLALTSLDVMRLSRTVKAQQAQLDRYSEEVDDRTDAPPDPVSVSLPVPVSVSVPVSNCGAKPVQP